MGWLSVIDFFKGGYSPELDRNALLEYRRGFDGEPFTMRLADQGDAFNVAGLWFRPPPTHKP